GAVTDRRRAGAAGAAASVGSALPAPAIRRAGTRPVRARAAATRGVALTAVGRARGQVEALSRSGLIARRQAGRTRALIRVNDVVGVQARGARETAVVVGATLKLAESAALPDVAGDGRGRGGGRADDQRGRRGGARRAGGRRARRSQLGAGGRRGSEDR